MKKLLGLLAITATLSTSAFAHTHDFLQFESEIPDEYQVQTFTTTPLSKNQKLSVDVYMRNFEPADEAKVRGAIVILEKIVNSEEFKQEVLNYTYKGVKAFHDNNGMTNEEIYNHLMTGAENLMPDSIGVMNFDLTLYRSKNPFSKVKGYTTADSMRIYINKKFFSKSSWTSLDVAGNMMHEWVHKMGFGHDYRDNVDRPHSVPYAIGYMLSDIAKRMNLK